MVPTSEVFAAAIRHHQSGQPEAAERTCQQILSHSPNHTGALHLLGVMARERGQHSSAVEYFDRLSELTGPNPGLLIELGRTFLALREIARAISCFERATTVAPDSAEAHNALGIAWSESGRLDLAVECFQRALQFDPQNASIFNNLGILHKNRRNPGQAVTSFKRALQLQPDFPQALNNLANALRDLGRLDEAIVCCRRAVELDPKFTDGYVTLGNALKDQGHLDEASACYHSALKLNPGAALIHSNLGHVFKDQGRLDAALGCYARAMELDPGRSAYHSNYLYTLNFHPGYSPHWIYEQHRLWSRKYEEPLARLIEPHSNDRSSERPLRVGYLSPDFRSHSVGRFMLPVLESHDDTQFEIYCYSSVRIPDSLTGSCQAQAAEWRDISGVTDSEAARMIREDRIDILVDLTMHMADNRLQIFSRKPAPVQVTYLAYCGTTGLKGVDYRLTDPFLDPPSHDDGRYSEESIRLPETIWCYRPIGNWAEVTPLPALERGRMTFGCLNNFCKVSDPTLATWIRLLQSLPGADLVVHSRPGSHRTHVRELFTSHGISESRLRFTDWQQGAGYFRIYEQLDVALDPFPHGGGTTTCDALWMGVPVVSLAGPTAVSRGGLSILSNVGLGELVASDVDQYVQIAVGLSRDLPRLRDLRESLRARMQASPVMDAPRLTRSIEAAYRQMWQRWCLKAGGASS